MRAICLMLVLLELAGCVSGVETPTALPAPTLPIATGIPATPTINSTTAAAAALPTPTVETLPTPENTAEIFQATNELLASYKPVESDPQPLYSALTKASGEFLAATANGDVSLEGQPALNQLRDALSQLSNLREGVKPQVVAIHIGQDQGGSRDLVMIGLQGQMGVPIVGLTRLGATYETMPPFAFQEFGPEDNRNFFTGQIEARDLTGDGSREFIYTYEYPGASNVTNFVTMLRWLPDKGEWHRVFKATLINWAGEADYSIKDAADATTIELTFPWFGAFDHKLVLHPTGAQQWEYDDTLDRFVLVSQTVGEAQTPRQQLNQAEYAFRNGDLKGAVALYERAWSNPALQKEDFGESKADPAAFAKFRQAMVLGLLGRDDASRKLVAEALKSGDALTQLAMVYNRNSTGKDGALRGWIAMANAGDLVPLLYESKAGNLDFPFESREVYLQGGIVASYLNTREGADKDAVAMWNTLSNLGFKPKLTAHADLNGDGANEFLFITDTGETTQSQERTLWFVYRKENAWRVRSLDFADTTQVQVKPLPSDKGRAFMLQLPADYSPTRVAFTWDGVTIHWLDAATLARRADDDGWPVVGGGVLEEDF